MFLKPFVGKDSEKLTKIQGAAILVLLFGCVAQGVMVYSFVQGLYFYAVIAHLIAALAFPWPSWYFIAAHYRRSYLIIILFFLLCLFIPLIASIGILVGVTLGTRYAKRYQKINFTTVEVPAIPDDIIKHIAYVQNLGSNVRSTLEYSNEANERIRAVLATRNMNNQDAIPILQIALLDPIDEIRLLAYSMLNTKEKKISASIQNNLNSLAEDNSLSAHDKATKYHYIAESYWELSYLGLEQGQAKIHVLKAAYYYVTEALKVFIDDSELYFLRGRISLELAQYAQANENFTMAIELGMSQQKMAPYQAELAFGERRFDEVKHYMQRAKYTAEKSTLTDMVKQWL